MQGYTSRQENDERYGHGRRTVAWSAIVAGTVSALAVQLVFALLGAGLGAAVGGASVRPDVDSPGMGAVIWLILSGVVSFGIGGVVAGALAGALRAKGGAIHGMLAWALAAVLGAGMTALAGSAALGGIRAGIGGAASASHAVPGSAQPGVRALGELPGRESTDTEARAAAQRDAERAAQVSLWTGVAFLLSMGAGALGGTISARPRVLHTEPEARRPSNPAVA